ncbi:MULTISPECIES: Phenylacetic acid catabolic protein [unclassified Beijerinckia]|uniref:Phenylacetic acid catabolic protein n=1 Tax=unclassified Beijerinckia TaxID=2638183 RepID=UPI00089C7124|nr:MULTISPECIES: Phenylacetic acid catabolic protein [unclassified Beijerinckia]MDH7798991.1 ring-1,2-phenylacetyl-CoA epoxidase subunit PaaA [Beijerinckia sp. GAS462]SED85001.1 1,2-phenylacetyl-CoA epoxidase, catalytic subunit [Beijerinckia sp. 28-YEA-48]
MTSDMIDGAETMPLADYLALGGKLTTPENAPPRYRGELLRLMATFVDSELAGAAGFAEIINQGPGIKERIAASRIVLEKLDHAERVLAIMGGFGADISRYANHHPWAERVTRDHDLGAARHGSDMRLAVLHYPLQGWLDAVVMNVLMGHAVVLQLGEFARVSYQPLGEIFFAILPRERRHLELGVEGLRKILTDPDNRQEVQRSIAYWRPRVVGSFGSGTSGHFETQKKFGLRQTSNADLAKEWERLVDALLAEIGLA